MPNYVVKDSNMKKKTEKLCVFAKSPHSPKNHENRLVSYLVLSTGLRLRKKKLNMLGNWKSSCNVYMSETKKNNGRFLEKSKQEKVSECVRAYPSAQLILN